MTIDLQEQLIELRCLTKVTGSLHELQLQQLKMYPRVLLPNAMSSEFEVDIEGKHIEFRLTTIPSVKVPNLNELLALLNQWVTYIVGSDWTMSVMAGLDTMFDNRT